MDRRLLILALGMFALGTDSFVFAGILPEIAHGFGVSIGAAGQLTTAYAITFALLAPTLAALTAAISRKRLLLGGLGLFVINLATIASPTLGIALATRILAGAGAALFSPIASGVATALTPPERRGFALSVIVAGLTTATALGTPLGAFIGGVADWRWTLALVATLGAAAFVGVWAKLPEVPLPAAISLRKRFAPLSDSRVGLTLFATLLAQIGTFIAYTYFSVVFDRAIGGSAATLGALLVLWGAAGTISNLSAGRVLDKIGPRKVVLGMMSVMAISLALMPFSGARLWNSAIAIFVWGACCWGVLVPQQYRLVSLNPSMAALLVGLNTSATYLGVSVAGILGAIAIPTLGAHRLGFMGVAIVVFAMAVSELATWRIATAQARALDLASKNESDSLVSAAATSPLPPLLRDAPLRDAFVSSAAPRADAPALSSRTCPLADRKNNLADVSLTARCPNAAC